MSFELRQRHLGSLGSAATMIGGGAMASRFLAQGTSAPMLSSEALDIVRDRVAPLVNAGSGPAPLVGSASAQARCNCMLNAIPGIAESEVNMQAGLTLCLQDPEAFRADIISAGWTTNCDDVGTAVDSAGSGGLTPVGAFIASTEGKVAIGAGVLAVLGLGAWFVLR